MDLTPYVDALRHELTEVTGQGTDESRALADRLVPPLQSATRLTLLAALTAATEEINQKLEADTVDVQLRGRDLEFLVAPTPAKVAPDDATGLGGVATEGDITPSSEPLPPAPEGECNAVSRVTFRLPPHLKSRVEGAAGRNRLSVNAWLLRAVAAAVEQDESLRAREHGKRVNLRFTGWVR
ncbi:MULTISPECIES: hypothetical protein [Streptomyces]|uniref:Histidine kinase n=1 Tax=Streptomyces alboflavus TaxID=67267 RepID=A0A1Z1WKQ4_9ACTN|nr:hypothetical protein [Streptomyces alboflavus]ARX87035.1 histidine kinase [Streptomyces alboflavus]